MRGNICAVECELMALISFHKYGMDELMSIQLNYSVIVNYLHMYTVEYNYIIHEHM